MTIKVNAHLHTPYSFSAFDSIPQALDIAVEENVQVVGINDFYSTLGFKEWNDECEKRNLYPLFNIEFIGLQQSDQKEGIRVNDPQNPGRTYLSGKGLAYPAILPEPYASQLEDVVRESNAQVRSMCEKLNLLLDKIGAGFTLDIKKIESELTRGNIRERHIAKALRIEAFKHFEHDEKKITTFFSQIFAGKELKSSLTYFAGVENEIRSNLLKAGGAAFVAESPKAFLPMEDVIEMIIAAGGIPTYPFLADDAKGTFTDFEGDLEKAASILRQRGIFSTEFIPSRNSVEVLERYAAYLWDQGFIVTLGTEHNTPAMEPVELFARDGVPLTDNLNQINYKSACVLAAHQHLFAKQSIGYLGTGGKADTQSREQYIALGDELIKNRIKK